MAGFRRARQNRGDHRAPCWSTAPVRRAVGATLDTILADELTTPLGIAEDLVIVPSPGQLHRLADIEGAAFGAVMKQLPEDSPFYRAVGGVDVESIVPRRVAPAGRTWRADAPLPFGATATARATARLYGALACGGELDGTRVLSETRIAAATVIRRHDVDEILGEPAVKSLGYAHADLVAGGQETAFGFGGLGGSEAYADPAHRFSFAFTHNRLTPPTEPDSAPDIAADIRGALGIPGGNRPA